MNEQRPCIAIIGAGAAGLCIGKHLKLHRIPFVIFEAASSVGGLWVYDSDSELSPAYLSLHLNSEAKVTQFKDFPFPDGSPIYPDHFQVRAYLERYAEHHDLIRSIRFGTRVMKVEPSGNGWLLTLADGTEAHFDKVIVASGHQSIPRHPEWRSQFTGNYLHAHSYRVPEPFKGRDVLVVGMGNSAVDIAADICVVTASTTMSVRSPVLLMPRMMFGIPLSRIFAKIERPWLPWPVRRAAREFLTWIVHGTMEQWGFTTPKKKTHATTHPNLISHFMWSRISARPGVKRISGREVEFTDDTTGTYDTIIAATGYQYTVPFLPKSLQPTQEEGIDLYLRMLHPAALNLFFMGVFNVNGGGNIRLMDDQAEWLTPLITGKSTPPSQSAMIAAIAQERLYLRKRFPDSIRYALELEPRRYCAQLRRAKLT